MKYMVLDIESIGLHGEAFAFAYVVVDSCGNRLDEHWCACPPSTAKGSDADRKWVLNNVPQMEPACNSPIELRNAFWSAWGTWNKAGAILVADCGWPVEHRFLAACIDDEPAERNWQGPYPLHDLASIILAQGGDPLATNERNPDELPLHHPLSDARQSARLLIEAMEVIDDA